MTPRREWYEVYPAAIVDWAWVELRRHQQRNGDLCNDNERVARKGHSSGERRYRKQQREGCCGNQDFERVGPDGETYLLGYNYGH